MGSRSRLLLDYWRAVEQSTLTYLAALTDEELNRVVTVEDWPPQHQRFKLDDLARHDSRDAPHRTDCGAPALTGCQTTRS